MQTKKQTKKPKPKTKTNSRLRVTHNCKVAPRRPAKRQYNVEGLRHDSRDTRQRFTDVLAQYGCKEVDFKECTTIINEIILGKRASAFKAAMGIGAKDSLRDRLNFTLISAVTLSEALAADRIVYEAHYGVAACKAVCKTVAEQVFTSITKARQADVKLGSRK